jgi:hypothetical protein
MSKAGSRKKNKLTKIKLSECGWAKEHKDALEDLKRALVSMVPLVHPQDDVDVCVYTDASQDSSGNW